MTRWRVRGHDIESNHDVWVMTGWRDKKEDAERDMRYCISHKRYSKMWIVEDQSKENNGLPRERYAIREIPYRSKK